MMFLRRAVRPSTLCRTRIRFISTENYADKIRKRAEEQNKSVEDLKTAAKDWWRDQSQKERESLQQEHEAIFTKQQPEKVRQKTAESAPAADEPRQDASPVKPLSSILNLPKLFASEHTPKDISDLWVSYHTLRSDGSGKGFVSACIPLDAYKKMSTLAEKYPSLVVPLPRPKDPESSEEADPYEFYFMEWAFHHKPPVPSAKDGELFAKPSSTSGRNPRISTVIFTPLQEYKVRGAYATPYLVLTNYTDLASTHDTVLLRGEITPSQSNSGQHLLKQEDAQYLAMTLQKFFLWDESGGEGRRLLETFHERPNEFRWEDLIQYARL